MKKVISLLLSIVMLFSLTAELDFSAYAVSNDDFSYTVLDDSTAEIVGYEGSKTELIIPDIINGYTITRIGEKAFYERTSLTDVTIPDSVTSIGALAFRGCAGLTRTNYAGTIDQWCEISFYDNYTNPIFYSENLYINDEIVTEANITNAKRINDYAFYNCKSLESVTIPDSITSIGKEAFYECTNLTKTNYTGTIDQWCEINFDDGYSNPAASYCENLYINDEIVTEANITNAEKINDYAFSCCVGLTSVIISDCTKSIGSSAFYSCTGLTSVAIGDNVTSIDEHAFCNCVGLTNIIIPNSMKNIGNGAFYSCVNLRNVTIGSGVTNIGNSAFYGCKDLTDVYYNSTVSDWGKISIDSHNECLTKAIIHCTDGVIKQHTHNYETIITKATLTKNGSIVIKCTDCGDVKSSTTIYYPKTISLSKTSLTYNGKAQPPTVTVKDSNGTALKRNTDYKVTYQNSVNPGIYTVKIEFIGNYTGTKNLSYTIKPRSTSISSVAGVANGFTVKWSKVAETTGYQIQYATKSDFSNAATVYGGATNTTSKTITGRAAGTKYYVRVRTYKNINGSYVWGDWTAAKAVTTKVPTATEKSVSGVSKGFKVTWNKITGVTGYQVQYATKSNFSNAATVYAGNASAVCKTITGRAKSTKYYVRVRAYKNNGDSYVYGAWSTAKAVTTK